jgi:GNAT superfamily N-acetyltransferase
VLRPARVSDAVSLARVHIASWQAAYRGQIPDSHLDGLDPRARAEWFRRTIAGGGAVLVAELDEGPIGFCYFGASRIEGEWGEIYAIYVEPSNMGAGHGSVLLARAEQELAEGGFAKALLWVLQTNRRARAFYEREGWLLAKGLKIEEIGGTQVSEVRYEKALRGRSAPDRGQRGK